MEKYPLSQLQNRQQTKLIKVAAMLEDLAKRDLRSAKKDAEELKRFIHMMRALAFISPNERNHYIAAIDGIIANAEPKHDDTLYGSIKQSGEIV